MNIFFVIYGVLSLLILLSIDTNIAKLSEEIKMNRERPCPNCTEGEDDDGLGLEDEY